MFTRGYKWGTTELTGLNSGRTNNARDLYLWLSECRTNPWVRVGMCMFVSERERARRGMVSAALCAAEKAAQSGTRRFFFSSSWDHSQVAHLPAHRDSVSRGIITITWERLGSPQPWLWGAPLCLFKEPSESWCCCLYCRIPRSAVKKRAAVSLSVISFYCIWIVIRKKEMKPESRGWATE